MSLEVIHLRKLLKIFYLPSNRQTAELRSDIRGELAREEGAGSEGGDFYGPFWTDARDHVFHRRDLHDAVRSRIEANPRRARLYPELQDGFLRWWNERRRWTNEPFQAIEPPHARHRLEGLGIVKVENILAVRDAAGVDHYIYPYFSELPVLGEEAARIGLWLIDDALNNIDINDVSILDVIRGHTFSIDRYPFQGDEDVTFRRRYRAIIRQWHQLWEDYD